MPLQKVYLLVDGFYKTTVAGKVKDSDPTAFYGTHSLSRFVVNILCSQQRCWLLGPLFALKALFQILFKRLYRKINSYSVAVVFLSSSIDIIQFHENKMILEKEDDRKLTKGLFYTA